VLTHALTSPSRCVHCPDATPPHTPHRYQDAALSRIAFNLMLTVSRPVMYLTPRINHLLLLAPEEVARQRATMMGLMQAGEVCMRVKCAVVCCGTMRFVQDEVALCLRLCLRCAPPVAPSPKTASPWPA
jgi:hypothetical protein